jgi:hypothetical protein
LFVERLLDSRNTIVFIFGNQWVPKNILGKRLYRCRQLGLSWYYWGVWRYQWNPGALDMVTKKKRGRPPLGAKALPEERATVINLKGSDEMVAWLEYAHETTHIPKTQIVRLGVAAWAKQAGLRPPPKI